MRSLSVSVCNPFLRGLSAQEREFNPRKAAQDGWSVMDLKAHICSAACSGKATASGKVSEVDAGQTGKSSAFEPCAGSSVPTA